MKFEDVRLYVTGLIQACFSNKSTLDKLSESENNLLFNGNKIEGTAGVTFTPSVDTDGNLSWTNDGGLKNPTAVNIKGPQGNSGGVTAPINGFFTMYVDNDGNLYVLSETDMSGVFEYDDTTGNLYFVQEVNE